MKQQPTIDARVIRRALLSWYRKNKRDLPWRRTRDPYRIWISEVMLQQTRVAAVIPYYERFLKRFPDVTSLAAAPEQDLLAAWAGLGYYSRARNLQKAAKQILELDGFPSDYLTIRSLAGVGDYTASAILSIAFDVRRPVLDGNAARVLSRLTAESGDIGSAVVRKRLLAVADSLIDSKHPGEFNQGLMELGATICLPKEPACTACPLRNCCAALQLGRQREIPLTAGKPRPLVVEKKLLVIEKAGRVLMWQRPAGSRRMAGFWELPEPSQLPGARIAARHEKFRHTIVNTRYCFEVFRAALVRVPRGFRWLATKNLHEVPLSTTAKKALLCLGRRGGG